jgi:hypothetical protein
VRQMPSWGSFFDSCGYFVRETIVRKWKCICETPAVYMQGSDGGVDGQTPYSCVAIRGEILPGSPG